MVAKLQEEESESGVESGVESGPGCERVEEKQYLMARMLSLQLQNEEGDAVESRLYKRCLCHLRLGVLLLLLASGNLTTITL